MSTPRPHIAFCPHCGNRSPQRVVLEHTYRDVWYSEDGTPSPPDSTPDSEAIVCVCGTCDSLLVYDGISREETQHWPELAYPRDFALSKFVPGGVSTIYHEAAMVKRNAPNAFAILIRKALEAICDDRGAPAGTLAKRLKFLSDKGEIPPVLSKVTDVIRVVGNSAAHASLQKITPQMTWAIDDFFRAIVEYVYVAPSKLDEFQKKLASTKEHAG